MGDQVERRLDESADKGHFVHAAELADDNVGSQEEMLNDASPEEQADGSAPSGSSETNRQNVKDGLADPNYDAALDFWEPKPPKVLMQNPEDRPLELHSQIQLYASTECGVSFSCSFLLC